AARGVTIAAEAVVLADREDSPHPLSQAHALCLLAWVHHLRREAPQTQKVAEALLHLSNDQALPFYGALATIHRGWALGAQGQRAEGMAQIRQGLVALQATGTKAMRGHILGMLAELLGEDGQVREGLATVAE